MRIENERLRESERLGKVEIWKRRNVDFQSVKNWLQKTSNECVVKFIELMKFRFLLEIEMYIHPKFTFQLEI